MRVLRRSLAVCRRNALRAEHGVTLIELSVAMSLMAVGATIFGPMLTSAMGSAKSVQLQSESIDNLTIASTAIARELRSAQCITSPAENTTGTTLDFTTAATNGEPYEVVYAVAGGTLTRTVKNSTLVVTEADHLVSTSDAFRQIATPRRTVVLTFRVQVDPKRSPRVFTTTIAGRNAWRTCPAPL